MSEINDSDSEKRLIVFFGTPDGTIFIPPTFYLDRLKCAYNISEIISICANIPKKLAAVLRVNNNTLLIIDCESYYHNCSVLKAKHLVELISDLGRDHDSTYNSVYT
ncbi:unnamed protein product [Macrosiphum euphorbiae]|uniref:Uncharacterized protein n=1 Tax=Macrosiphum euphorbiae TaxID=13131 RepID=A0AAV0VUF6_9HEMI|nr:unnamed protein product [Macrosiphum euphorbiae]